MLRLPLTLLALSLLLVGCRVDPDPPNAKAKAKAQPSLFGKPLQGVRTTPLTDILDHPERFSTGTVAVEGRVARACTRKGCWLEIAALGADGERACRVTFEDYAFFVPKDSAGMRARLEGKVVTTRVKPAHVEHLESEGAKFSSKNSDGSAVEVQIVASGVELERDGGTKAAL
jgi:hypothetical protein